MKAAALALLLSSAPLWADTEPPLAIAPFDAARAAELQQAWARQSNGALTHTNGIGMKLVFIPPGEFTMGRTTEELERLLARVDQDPELKKNRGGMLTWSMLMMPAHRVRLTRPFYLGSTEVTVGQFRAFTEASGYRTEAEQGLNHGKPYKGRRPISTWRKPMAWRKPPLNQAEDEPVLHLCWNDCMAFCAWLSKTEGVPYVLPTEAEWEYACRAGTTTPWHFGDYEDVERVAHHYAWWSDGAQAKHDRPRVVGKGRPNAFGLHDMHGNVWEYVADWWHRLAYKESPLNDPTGPAEQSEKNDQRRIIRGSSFDWGRWGGSSDYRMRITQRSNQHPHMGFRVVRRLPGVRGAPPAVDPGLEARSRPRDPGANAPEVVAALKPVEPRRQAPAELNIDLGGEVSMAFVRLPAGHFLMGSDRGDRDEQPVHRVVISKPFYLARHELTQSQWEAIMGPDARLAGLRTGDNQMSGPDKAMNGLSWQQCRNYIRRLKRKVPGHAFALPTEAQWEYACRAGSDTAYHFGNDPEKLGDYAWFSGNMIWPGQPGYQGKAFYHDVGRKKPNHCGVYDLHGGVWEWCADRYAEDYYQESPLVDPAGPAIGALRVLRGGSWFRRAAYARSAYRRPFHPACDGDGVTAWILDFGCRLVINLADKKAGAAVPHPMLQRAENLVKHGANPVLDTGEPGSWDAERCGCFSVERVGERLHLYYMGAGAANAWRIGLATSSDGLAWERHRNNPVLPQGPPGSWDEKAVSMPYALQHEGKTRLWYTGSGKSGGFGLATSADGVTWNRHGTGPVMRGIGGSMDPCVRHIDGHFVMWYVGKRGKAYRIFRARSPDGIAWTKESEPELPLGEPGDFDENSHAGPVVVRVKDRWYLFHLGGGKKGWQLGLAYSADGEHWTKSAANPILQPGGPEAWDGGSILGHDVRFRDGRFRVWYAAHTRGDAGKAESEMTIRIGYAESRWPNPEH